MSEALVEPDRLGNWLGIGEFVPDSPEETRAVEVITTISDLVRGEARRDWTQVDVPGNIAAIILMIAVECWANPDNKTSVTIDDVTRRWESGDLFSSSQLSIIRSFRPNQTSGIGTVQFSRGFDAPSIALPGEGRPGVNAPSASAVLAPSSSGGESVILYDGRGY